MLRAMLMPFVILIVVGSGYWAVVKIGENDERYSLSRLPETARITAYDIGFYTGKNAGSRYSLGEFDGTFTSILMLSPQAVNVALFRPYLWEVKNPLMLLSALESFVILMFTIYVLFVRRQVLFKMLVNPHVVFCLVFSITFAFAVGLSTFNFGTLARYKIPLLPFYIMALSLMMDYSKSDKKLDIFEETE
jgi:hypothetical protein